MTQVSSGTFAAKQITPILCVTLGFFAGKSQADQELSPALFAEVRRDGDLSVFYIASTDYDSRATEPTWSEVIGKLGAMAVELGVIDHESIEESGSDQLCGDILRGLAQHYHADSDFKEWIDHFTGRADPLSESATLEDCFYLALSLDDGHGLAWLIHEGMYHEPRSGLPRLNENGGYCSVQSAGYCATSNTSTTAGRLFAMSGAVVENDVERAADILLKQVQEMSTGIQDEEFSRKVMLAAADKIAQSVLPENAARLVLNVEYDLDGDRMADMRDNLCNIVDYAVVNGLLTGNSVATVENYSCEVLLNEKIVEASRMRMK